MRRALRLLPALVTLVIVLALVLLATTSREYRLYLALYVAAVLFYFANWVEPFGIPLAWGFGHTWSLAIEEQFYLIWPVALAGLLRFVRRRAAVAAIVTCGAVLAFTYRMILARAGVSHIRPFEGSDTHADPLLIRRPTRYGLSIQFEARPDDAELARLVETTIWINEASGIPPGSGLAVRGLPRRARHCHGAGVAGGGAGQGARLPHDLPCGVGRRPRATRGPAA